MAAQIIGIAYSWFRGDPLPPLPPLDRFRARLHPEPDRLARLHNLPAAEMEQRISEGNRPYIAFLDNVPAGYGWVVTRSAHIGELGIQFEVPRRERFFWDFVTLEPFRGRGVYPHLLQAALRAELEEAERFWLGHDVENSASMRGILKAGFRPHGMFVRDETGEFKSAALGDNDRALLDPQLQPLPFTRLPDSDIPDWIKHLDRRVS